MTEVTNGLCAKLDALYDVVRSLTPASSDQEFSLFASLFAKDCKVYLKSMNLHDMPSTTRQEAIEDMKEMLEKFRIQERVILNASATADGRTLFCETRQRPDVMGEVLEPFFETEVVIFDNEGLIKELRLYNCWSAIVRIVQDKTREGPYSEDEAARAWENVVKAIAPGKFQRRKELLSTGCCT